MSAKGLMGRGRRERVAGSILLLSVEEILPNPKQPRRHFDEQELISLSESIRCNGLLQPISVRRSDQEGGRYEIIAGERRWRAAKLAGLSELPCILIDADVTQSAVLALIENLQRQDLSFFEEAAAIARLIDSLGITQEEAARRLGKAQSTIANKLRLLRLTPPEVTLIERHRLSERHARALIRLDDPELRLRMIEEIAAEELNVAQTEALVERKLLGDQRPDPRKVAENTLTSAELRAALGRRGPGAGMMRRVVIKDIRLFANSIRRAVDVMRRSGLTVESHTQEQEQYIEYLVKIQKPAAGGGSSAPEFS